jgi:adenosylhomocysteine nucleosidase
MYKVLFLLVLFTSLSFSSFADNIAFFYALDQDFAVFEKQSASARQLVKIGSREISILTFGSNTIYAVKMGSGSVETAVSVQGLLARFRCDLAISLGPVGSLNDEIKIGEWVRPHFVTAYQHGSQSSLGFQLAKNSVFTLFFPPSFTSIIPRSWREVKSVKIASGEIFVNSNKFRTVLANQSQADAVDMNLFGLQAVLQDHQIPHAAWRIVSDRADNTAGEDFRNFVQNYHGEGGLLVMELIKALPPNPNSPQSYDNIRKLIGN